MTKTDTEFEWDDEVVFPWGISEVHGRVREVYGPPGRRHVVVLLTPELSSLVVDEPTTVSMPIDSVTKFVPPAA